MKKIINKFIFILLAILMPQTMNGIFGCKRRCKRVTKVAKVVGDTARTANKQIFYPAYKAESVRTAILRIAMSIHCLSDGSCSATDAYTVALALASSITACTYNASAKGARCTLLPKKLNLLADGIATISSCDAGKLPITDTDIESQTRFIFSCLSMFATGAVFLF